VTIEVGPDTGRKRVALHPAQHMRQEFRDPRVRIQCRKRR
jgi:hypothetical protein